MSELLPVSGNDSEEASGSLMYELVSIVVPWAGAVLQYESKACPCISSYLSESYRRKQ